MKMTGPFFFQSVCLSKVQSPTVLPLLTGEKSESQQPHLEDRNTKADVDETFVDSGTKISSLW